MKTSRFTAPQIALAAALMLGALLRFYGLNWGLDHQTGQFHRFHPDETTIVESARLVGADIEAIQASYGKAPMYLLWAAAHTFGPIAGIAPFDLDDNASAKFTHVLGRAISALMGVLLIGLVFHLGNALHGPHTGALAAFLMAVCPGHIQQSHYYTVDPALAFWATLALLLMLRLPCGDWRPYLACGILCGLAAGTRLIGVYLALPFALIHLFPRIFAQQPVPQLPFGQRLRELPYKHIGIAAGAGIAVLLVCEPFLLLNPQHYFDTSDIRMFAPSVQVARGELLRVWTLYDLNTAPYLFYITHLLRYALTIPLEIAGLAGIGLALWKRPAPALVILSWLVPYFLLVGGLHTKPVRYVAPMLPLLIALGAWACVLLGQALRTRWPSPVAAVLPGLITGLIAAPHGLAVARTYGLEDSRIQAARYVAEHIPEGSRVLVEHGGFPSAWMAPENRYRRETTDGSYYIASKNWATYSSHIDHFKKRVTDADWIILVEENHLRQFSSAPGYFPIASEIYRRLDAEELGFHRVARFKNHPSVGPWTRNEHNAEPTITAFDRPAVSIFRRTGAQSVETILDEWRRRIQESPALPDLHILSGVEAFKQQDWTRALQAFERALEIHPSFALACLLIGEIHIKHNDMEAAQREWDRAMELAGDIPRHAFIGIIEAGLKAEGVHYLETIATQENDDPELTRLAAYTYFQIGLDHQQTGDHKAALDAYTKAIVLNPDQLSPYANAAGSLMTLGGLDQAEDVLALALQRDSTYAPVQQALARLHIYRNNLESAYQTLEKALNLHPKNLDIQTELFNLGAMFYERGHRQQANAAFEKILAHNPEFQGLHYNLGVLRLESGDFDLAHEYLEEAVRHAPDDAEARIALASACEKLGLIDQAIAHYRRALELQPGIAPAEERLRALQP